MEANENVYREIKKCKALWRYKIGFSMTYTQPKSTSTLVDGLSMIPLFFFIILLIIILLTLN